ncbi:MAG TPA: response regulator [Chloroflexia bacterium]|nr:response regulator [Chloroflexia bacterium]
MARILIVEDNEMNTDILARTLARADHLLLTAADGEAGLALALAEQPDLILMDIGLPGIDGLEVTRRLKAAPATRQIPVLAVTAYAMAGDRELCLAAGCEDYISKPFDADQVVEKVARLLARRQRLADLLGRQQGDDPPG